MEQVLVPVQVKQPRVTPNRLVLALPWSREQQGLPPRQAAVCVENRA